MFMDLLIIFIILAIIFFILSIIFMESDNPTVAIPFIMLGMIFTVLCTYGCWNVEIAYTSVNVTSGGTDLSVYSTEAYGNPYSYVFVLFFFIYLVLFFKTGFNMWEKALDEDKEAERILFDLSRDGRAYTDNRKFVRAFGCKHRDILDNGFLDIATTNYGKRKNKTIFVTRPGILVQPRTNERGINFHFKRFKIL